MSIVHILLLTFVVVVAVVVFDAVVVTVVEYAFLKGNQKGNIKCYARERANTKQPF